MVYEDDEARILKIRDQKGEPPNDEDETNAPETTEENKQSDEEENQASQANINQTTEDKNEEN
jgi:hypothetical protein